MNQISTEKKKQIETIGLYFEKELDLTPLTARIFGLLVVSSSDGLSFDQITEVSCASKSSVSTSVNLLLQLKAVEYFTKPNDRKRYFRISHNHLYLMLIDELNEVNKGIDIINTIIDYNKEKKAEKYQQVRLIFREYLLNNQKNIQQTLDKISHIQNN
ncbi:MAG: GbsR/MarR family transcriptional regulator [Mesonia hippocampi]|uniref:GbsR/MarR family transcriptional regulator n=1 Tax=Mesonia hippocampi TaxID=1628250 RepID=UPI003F9B2273